MEMITNSTPYTYSEASKEKGYVKDTAKCLRHRKSSIDISSYGYFLPFLLLLQLYYLEEVKA